MFPAVPIDLTDKRILVTGAARGIGRAAAELAVMAGAHVVATDIRADDLAELDQAGPGAVTTVPFDLTDTPGLDALVARVVATLDGLDALVHVAGVILRRDSIDEVTEQDWDLQCDVNLKATFFLNRAVAAVLGAQSGGGAIVNFSSQGWWTGGFGGSVAYSATKGGVVSVSRGLARSLASRGVRVNVVAPGAVDTAMMEDLDDQAMSAFLAQVPLGRMAAPAELAHAALFLISDAASYITGATLNVSGGQLMY